MRPALLYGPGTIDTKPHLSGLCELAVKDHARVRSGPNYDTLQDSLLESRFTLVRHLRSGDCKAARSEMRSHLQRVHEHVLAIQKIAATRKP